MIFFSAALRVAKRVAAETSINDNRVSIASVAVSNFARNVFERFDDKQILVIGAGETAEEVLVYLCEAGAKHITVVNRSEEAAAKLAKQYSGRAASWNNLDAKLIEADLIVTPPALRSQSFLCSILRHRAASLSCPLFILDLAVPRDFDPAIGDCLGVYLYSIDDLQEVCRRNCAPRRDKELPQALTIVEEETSRFMQELYHCATGPIIRQLRQGWHEVRDDELRRLFNKLPDLDDRARQEITQAFERLCE